MANKIHLNIAKRDEGFPRLLHRESGLCTETVINPQIACIFDEVAMEHILQEYELYCIRNICKKCVNRLRETTPEKVYLYGFCEGERDASV